MFAKVDKRLGVPIRALALVTVRSQDDQPMPLLGL